MANDVSRKKNVSGLWDKRGLLMLGLAVVSVSIIVLLPPRASKKNGSMQTHVIRRDDLIVTVTEEGVLESSDNTEIRCKVRGQSVITWVIESGTHVEPGDDLVRLDALAIEDAIAERTKYAHWSRSSAERSTADVVRSELAISEYLEGRYRTELMGLEKDLTIAKSNRLTAQNLLAHAETMAQRGYVSDLNVEQATADRIRAELNVEVTKKQMEVLQQYTKAMELETLKGNLNEARARHAANVERAKMDEARRVLAVEEFGYCVIKAERSGLVIHPSAARWKEGPEIEEGGTVHKNQVLLLMPNLDKMQVKIGIHESLIDRIKPGLGARIKLPDKTIDGKITSVAEVTDPAGWWTGNVVKYDVIIKLTSVLGLKPGMSADVEVTIAQHENVLTIPVNALLQTVEGTFCWVKTSDETTQRRELQLGDTDGQSVVILKGLQEGDEVWLDPLTAIVEAQVMAITPVDSATQPVTIKREVDHVN
ncbi:MAG: HlyD family efflux transporter periplasmic adaptor subunit [Planctomycetes bacterium]|nr:HlyD family efflux transporter periplasmic adaptor subunit [Planctomycetota bacterium]